VHLVGWDQKLSGSQDSLGQVWMATGVSEKTARLVKSNVATRIAGLRAVALC